MRRTAPHGEEAASLGVLSVGRSLGRSLLNVIASISGRRRLNSIAATATSPPHAESRRVDLILPPPHCSPLALSDRIAAALGSPDRARASTGPIVFTQCSPPCARKFSGGSYCHFRFPLSSILSFRVLSVFYI